MQQVGRCGVRGASLLLGGCPNCRVLRPPATHHCRIRDEFCHRATNNIHIYREKDKRKENGPPSWILSKNNKEKKYIKRMERNGAFLESPISRKTPAPRETMSPTRRFLPFLQRMCFSFGLCFVFFLFISPSLSPFPALPSGMQPMAPMDRQRMDNGTRPLGSMSNTSFGRACPPRRGVLH